MSGLVFLRILLLAAEALAASCALPGLAWAASLAFRKRANLRHLIRTAAFAGLLALPLATLLPTQVNFHHAVGAQRVRPVSLTATLPDAAPALHHALMLEGGTILVGLLTVWALGVLVVAGQSLIAALALRDLRRRSVLHSPPCEIPRPAGRAWELRLSSLCSGPMTWGVLRPVVLLPWDAIHWPSERMQTVLAHELAHVRRRDCLAQAMATAACALYWPNPLVWLAARALRRDAEIAADDAVIVSGVRPSDYAEALVSMAKAMRGQRLALAMASPSGLAERVSSILSPAPVRTGVTIMDAFKIFGAGCVATAALALARPGIAETPAPTQPAPAPVALQELLAPPSPTAPTANARAKPTPKPAAKHTVVVTSPDGETKVVVDSAQISADVRKAIADAHISETVAKEVAAAQDRAQAEVAKQLADLEPRIQKALADAHVEDKVAKQLADLQPRIDAAIAKANAAAAKAQERAQAAQEAADKAHEQPKP